MTTIPIAFVVVDFEDRLQIYPDVPKEDGYTHIYRDASGVNWDSEKRCLVSEVPRKLSHQQWFEIIRKAVEREYGVELILTKFTSWEKVPLQIQQELTAKYSA